MGTVNYSLAHMSSKPGDKTAPKLYYAKAQASGVVTIDEIAEEIAYATAMTEGDVLCAIRSLIRQLTKHLSNGKIVRMDQFGSFQLQLQSEGAESIQAFTSSNITGVSIQFRPSGTIRASTRAGDGGLSFHRVARLKDVAAVDDTQTGTDTGSDSTTEDDENLYG